MNRDLDARRRLLWWALGGAVVLCAAVLVAAPWLTSGDGDPVIDRLADGPARGPAVLVFRHALTDTTRADADPTARGTCAQQRNLSDAGLAQAERIGHGIRDRGIVVEAVLASPFCRTVDTAAAFDLGPVVESDALTSLTAFPEAEDQAALVEQAARLVEDHLEGARDGDGVMILVTHTQNIEAMTGELVDEGVLVDEGDAVVLVRADSPSDDGAVAVAGIIPADAW